MEKRRSIKLYTLLVKYVFTLGISILLTIIIWIVIINFLIGKGFIYSADTGEKEAKKSAVQLEKAGYFDVTLVSSFCNYVLLSQKGAVIQTNMSKKALEAAENFYATGYNRSGKYHITAQLGDEVCILQYEFRTLYYNDSLNEWLPDFQKILLIGMPLSIIMLFILVTAYYGRKLKYCLEPLNMAVKQLSEGELDLNIPISGIQEFNDVLRSIDHLRTELKDSMIEKWKMEQERLVQISALVHDLKTPLTVISGNAELLAETAKTDEQILCSNTIIKNVQQTRDYVNKLREVSKEGPILELSKNTVRAHVFIDEMRRSVQEICKVNKRRLEFHSELVSSLMIDNVSIIRSIDNIVENGCRYTNEGGVIHVHIYEKDKEQIIEVEDSGPGFKEEALKHGLDLFYTENENRNPSGHSGIGLAYAKRIARAHNGDVKLMNSEQGHGMVLFCMKCQRES